jgi:hypothetical protein
MTDVRRYAPHAPVGWLLALALFALTPQPAVGQLGVFDALGQRFSDVSFFGSVGGLLPTSNEVTSDRLWTFGIEALFEIGTVSRPVAGAIAPARDSVELRWTGREVVRRGSTTDTVDTYEVRKVVPEVPEVTLWTFEVGVGYGQLTGFDASEEGLSLKGAVRDLPALSLYATYEPVGAYFGLRSGFMRFQGLQLIDPAGVSYAGQAESFLAGLILGQSFDVMGLLLFAEGAYTFRFFPSVSWSGDMPPVGTPREISLSNWSVGTGIQFGVGGR